MRKLRLITMALLLLSVTPAAWAYFFGQCEENRDACLNDANTWYSSCQQDARNTKAEDDWRSQADYYYCVSGCHAEDYCIYMCGIELQRQLLVNENRFDNAMQQCDYQMSYRVEGCWATYASCSN